MAGPVLGFGFELSSTATQSDTRLTRESSAARISRVSTFLESENTNQRAAALRQLREDIGIDDLPALRRFLSGRPPRQTELHFLDRWNQLLALRLAETEAQIADFEAARLRARRLTQKLDDLDRAAAESDGADSPQADPDRTPGDESAESSEENRAAGTERTSSNRADLESDLDLARNERDTLRQEIRQQYRFLLDQGIGVAAALWSAVQSGGLMAPAVERFRDRLQEDLVREAQRLFPTAPAFDSLGALDARTLIPLLDLICAREPNVGWQQYRLELATRVLRDLYSTGPLTRSSARQIFLELGQFGVQQLRAWVDQPPAGISPVPKSLRQLLAERNRWAVPVSFVDQYSIDVSSYPTLDSRARWEIIARLEWTAGADAIPVLAALLGGEPELALEVEIAAALARLSDPRGVFFLQQLGLEDAVALERVSRRVLLLEAIHRREAGEYQAAIDELEAILRRFPGDHRVHYELGYAGLLSRQLEIAIRHFRLALAYSPDDRLTHYNLACALTLNKQLDQAMESLQLAVRNGFQDPAHISADTDLSGLRGREDFKRLVDSLSR